MQRETLDRALLMAVINRLPDLATQLLEKGAKNFALTKDGKDVLHVAIDNNDLPMFMLLICYSKKNNFCCNPFEKDTAVIRAAKKNLWQFVEAHITVSPDVHMYDQCLFLTIQNDQLPIAKLLIDRKVSLDYQDPQTKNTALHEAIIKNDVASVETLICAGAKLSVENAKSQKPIILAATLKHWKCVIAIARLRKATEDSFGYSTAIISAAHFNLYYVVSVLLDAGTDSNCWGINTKNTALHKAVLCANPPMISLLLKNSADPNLKNIDDLTPIELAIKKELPACVSSFLNPRPYTVAEIKYRVLRLIYMNTFNCITPAEIWYKILNENALTDFQGAFNFNAIEEYFNNFVAHRHEIPYINAAAKFVKTFEETGYLGLRQTFGRITSESATLCADIKSILTRRDFFFNRAAEIRSKVEAFVAKKAGVKSGTVNALIALNLFTPKALESSNKLHIVDLSDKKAHEDPKFA